MNTYWLKFTDGSEGHCQGRSAYDAVLIAQHITQKTVDLGKHKWNPELSESVQQIPYPAKPMIWQFDHPIHGKTPEFCYGKAMCHGKLACPNDPSCTN